MKMIHVQDPSAITSTKIIENQQKQVQRNPNQKVCNFVSYMYIIIFGHLKIWTDHSNESQKTK